MELNLFAPSEYLLYMLGGHCALQAAGYGAPSGEKVVYSSSDDEARSVVVSYKARKSGVRGEG